MPRSSHRLHDRTSFYKYMPASTAKILVDNNTLRWSSPSLFNDPFDVPRELSFGITPAQIIEALGRRCLSLLENPPENTSDLEPNLKTIVDTINHGIDLRLRTKMHAELKQSAETYRPTGASLEALRQLWRTLVPNFRILCLTESPDHSAMWFHYADQYRGAVLEFACSDELDSAWLMAKPVTYPTVKPEIYEADGWAKILTMRHDLAINTIYHTATYTKSPDWSYEKEWRLASLKRGNETGLYSDYKFDPRELLSVYLGPLISQNDKDSLVAATSKHPHVRIFEVSIGMSRAFVIKERGKS